MFSGLLGAIRRQSAVIPSTAPDTSLAEILATALRERIRSLDLDVATLLSP